MNGMIQAPQQYSSVRVTLIIQIYALSCSAVVSFAGRLPFYTLAFIGQALIKLCDTRYRIFSQSPHERNIYPCFCFINKKGDIKWEIDFFIENARINSVWSLDTE